jgi:hypothetical protein
MWFITTISSFYIGGPGVVCWYGLYGSPAVCHWKELVLSKSFGL